MGVVCLKLLDKIETFITLADCLSFTETAKRLYCSQPTITTQIQQLEEQFQAILFLRLGKKIELTKQGEVLLEYAKKMTSLVEEATVKIKTADQKNAILSVYVSNYIATYFFTDILKEFHKAFPNQFLEVNSYCYDDLKRSLMEGKANFALMPIYHEDDYVRLNCDITILFEEEFRLVVPANHHWTKRKQLYSRDLNNQTVLIPQSQYLNQYISGNMAKLGIKARFLQMSNFEMIKQAVRSQHGIAFLPAESVKEDISKGELVSVEVASLRFSRQNGFVKRKNGQLTESEGIFFQEVSRYVGKVR